MTTLKELIAAFHDARAAWNGADPDADGGPAWDAYEEAEHAVIVFPCTTLAEVQRKARFFLENESAYDTIKNCYTTGENGEETLIPFLRSLCGGEDGKEARP